MKQFIKYVGPDEAYRKSCGTRWKRDERPA